ncbi:MAG: ribosome maturation factor RimP [Elusimicrobia bacterium]|nr:ribosome maturation factor RimP [Candidatus Liberimonas magnetica]
MSTIEELEKVIAPVLETDKFELVDINYGKEGGKKVLRVFIDKEGGVKLADCEAVSLKIEEAVETSELIPDDYVIEVSSPGLDRIIKKEKDFIKFTGQDVKISVFAPIDGQRNFTGKLLWAGEGKVKIADISGKTLEIEIEKIARARLNPEIRI